MSATRASGAADDAGDIDIRSGGLIAVDTETLRRVAGILTALSADCDDLADRLWVAGASAMQAGLWRADPSALAKDARDDATHLAGALRERAAVYEEVERLLAADAGATTARTPLDRMAAPVVDAGTAAAAAELRDRWERARTDEMDRQLLGATWPYLGVLAFADPLTGLVGLAGRGRIAAGDAPLSGQADPVRVRELDRMPVAAPTTLAQLAERIPGEGASRVRVEVYEKASGVHEYIAYITGTRDFGMTEDEPWDMTSNLDLYFGKRAASYEAVERALAAAGAVRGDTVHLVGHSQGAMVAARLARESDFHVASLVTFGSPVQAELASDVLTVTVRHTDDPVVALSDGGLPGIVGSSDSFVVDRVVDPQPGLGELSFDVHHLAEYVQTASFADASGDPRMEALHVQLAGLGGAVTATAIVYGARREGTSSGGGGVAGGRGASSGPTSAAPTQPGGHGVSGASSAAGGAGSRTPS